MGFGGVNVGSHGVRLPGVLADLGRGQGMVDRIQHIEEFKGLVAVPQPTPGNNAPDGPMGVLAAIFANPRRISLDIAGIGFGVFERRC